MKRMIFGAAALVLVLASCEMSAEINVNPDGSGTMGFSVGLPNELMSSIPGGEDPFGEFRSEFADSPVPFEFEEFSERGLTGMRARFAFSSIDDLESKARLMAQDDGGSNSAFGEDFILEQTAGGWRFEATGEAPNAGLNMGGTGGAGGEEIFGGEDPFGGEAPFGDLASLIDISFRVTLPGSPVEHNATETIASGGSTTYVWKLDPSSSAPVSMRAVASGGGGGSFPFVPVGVGVVLLGIGLMVAARMRTPSQPPMPVLESYGTPAPESDADPDEAVV